MKLRPYQKSIFNQLINSTTNDLVQLDTGAGKTPIIALLAKHYKQAIIVCHRNVLIKQASEKLAMCCLDHKILAAKDTKKICANNNLEKTGKHHINPRAEIILISIDTFISQLKRHKLDIDFSLGYVLIPDEAHHMADDNKWDVLQNMINGRTIGFTATPVRSDGQPLIKQYGGFFDRIVQAEGYEANGTERLISEGYLAEYQAFYAKPDMLLDNVVTDKNTLALSNSAFFAYEQYANNKKALVIYPRIINALQALATFKKYGVSAEIIHSGLPQYKIQNILTAFEQNHIKVLLAVDMINEGFDIPDCDVLILARVVKSFGLYRQLCGRVLRPREGKKALILDLNGLSISKHGLPSDPVNWNEQQGKIKKRYLTICNKCKLMYKSTLLACPNCGEPNNMRAKEGLKHLKIYFFDASIVEKERQKLRQEEIKRLKEEKEKQERLTFEQKYLTFSPNFGQTIIDKKVQYFYNEISKVLKKQLSPIEYNTFFKNHYEKMNKLHFYTQSITPEFEQNKEGQSLALYKEKS